MTTSPSVLTQMSSRCRCDTSTMSVANGAKWREAKPPVLFEEHWTDSKNVGKFAEHWSLSFEWLPDRCVSRPKADDAKQTGMRVPCLHKAPHEWVFSREREISHTDAPKGHLNWQKLTTLLTIIVLKTQPVIFIYFCSGTKWSVFLFKIKSHVPPVVTILRYF